MRIAGVVILTIAAAATAFAADRVARPLMPANLNTRALVPYEADYYFYR
jgi:hypothetical protein